MAKLEEDGSFELQQKRWTELIELRQAMADHRMDSAGVELAISNVFDLKKGPVIDSMIRDGKELMAMILRLEELQINSCNVKMALEKAFIPGMSGAYDADILRLKEMIKMREEMAKIGIPTGCIEATIAEKAFQPRSYAAENVKLEHISEASATEPCSLPTAIDKPAELDACDTAVFKRSNVETDKPAELEASENVITTQSSSSTAANASVESPARPIETKPLSEDNGNGRPPEMPSQASAIKSLSSDAEHITTIRASIERLDLRASSATTSPPLTKAPSVLTSPSTVRLTPSAESASSLSSPSTTHTKSSAKRSAPSDTVDALGSAQNPICLGSSPAPKRQRTAKNITSKADTKRRESWKVPIQSVAIMGLLLKPRYDDVDMSIGFDLETQRILFYKGQQSLTALYSDLEVDPEALLSVTRPTYSQSKQLKVRFIWLNTDAEEISLDIIVATKQDCRELIAKLKTLTSFSEILLSELRMHKLCGDTTWLVNRTQNAVGVSVTKFSENVWLD